MQDIYQTDIETSRDRYALPVEVVENDTDLYWHIALAMYTAVEKNNAQGRPSIMIVPVGPVFQYRRFVRLCRFRPLDLSGLHLFFMDEYLDSEGRLISSRDPLSFRGFVDEELIDAMPSQMGLERSQIVFPSPETVGEYDARLAELGGADICIAGVGINGHLAFNEPPEPGEEMSNEAFLALPSRVISLTRETITINSNTALRGAFDRVPVQAVTVGFRQIFSAREVQVYLNRPWQSAVVRRMLLGTSEARFPASLLQEHPDARITLTAEVARRPRFALK